MGQKNDGGPAFPVVSSNGLGHVSDGISIRDWFAGMALQGMNANTGLIKVSTSLEICFENMSKIAYEQADAMLKERDK